MAPRKTANTAPETPEVPEVPADTASLPVVFDIPEERFLEETRKRKPRAVPHRFQPIVKSAQEEGKPKGIVLHKDENGDFVDSEGEKVGAVASGLRTAAAQLGLAGRIKTYEKTDVEPPYLAFVVVTDATAELVKPRAKRKAKTEEDKAENE